MARWITILEAAVPFDYRWPGRGAITAFSKPGERFVKDEIADFAIGRGYATEGKASDSRTRSTKGGTRRRRSAKPKTDAKATSDSQRNARMADAHAPDHGGADAGPAVGTTSG